MKYQRHRTCYELRALDEAGDVLAVETFPDLREALIDFRNAADCAAVYEDAGARVVALVLERRTDEWTDLGHDRSYHPIAHAALTADGRDALLAGGWNFDLAPAARNR